MANFEISYNKTLNFEGGYANHPNDMGGETYKGVARKKNPNWEGWPIIDQMRNKPGFPSNLDSISELQKYIRNFYKAEFWDKFWGDKQSSQNIANELFDTSILCGPGTAIGFLQVALNVLNKGGKLYPEISEDGNYGMNTNNSIIAYLKKDDENLLLKILNVLLGYHFIKLSRNKETQEDFIRGWFKRVELPLNDDNEFRSQVQNALTFKPLRF